MKYLDEQEVEVLKRASFTWSQKKRGRADYGSKDCGQGGGPSWAGDQNVFVSSVSGLTSSKRA